MLIYLDMCCVKRSFDDQTQIRIHLETEAIDALLVYFHEGVHNLVNSDALLFENDRNPNQARKEFAQSILAMATKFIAHSQPIAQRANDWTAAGVSLLDALHLATAESGNVDFFVSSDDRLRHRAVRIDTTFRIISPLELMQELTP
ncbi:MAG: PIN domain-containing protein [Gemmatales bacterium]